jgi:hypothetical protein
VITGVSLGVVYYPTIEEEDDINHTIFKGLNNATVKIMNDIIDGNMRFIVDETNGDLKHCIPISI